MNKGLKLLFCKECNKKRFCKREPLPDYSIKWTCSKLHSWVIKSLTLERISVIMNSIIPQVKDLFERDNSFLEN